MCGLGAVNISCLEDGHCICQPGVIGGKCDQCELFHTNLSPSGCQPCGQCEQDLRTNLTMSEAEHNSLSESLLLLISLVESNTSGFENVYMLSGLLQDNVTRTDQYLKNIQTVLNALSISATDFSFILNATEENVSFYCLQVVHYSTY